MDEARNPWATAQRRAIVRGSLAACASTAIALVFHLMAGGAMPALPGLVVPLLLAAAVCVLLAGLRMPWVRLLSSVAASQALFHTLFVLGSTQVGHAGHGAHAAAAATSPTPLMLLAHAAAAVLTAAALRHGELILARVRATLRRLGWRFLGALRAAPARPTAAPSPLADEQAWVPTAQLLVRVSLVRRGPPALLIASLP